MTSLASNEMNAGHTEVTLEEVLGVLSAPEFEEFDKCLTISQRILDNPTSMVGSEAGIAAAQLAALRTKIGLRAQHYKTSEKSITQRRRKDLLLTMYHSLEENINTLKLLSRLEASMIGQR